MPAPNCFAGSSGSCPAETMTLAAIPDSTSTPAICAADFMVGLSCSTGPRRRSCEVASTKKGERSRSHAPRDLNRSSIRLLLLLRVVRGLRLALLEQRVVFLVAE